MFLMIVGMTIITVSILVTQITKNTFNKNNPNLDVVVGAKGSPLQLILSTIHHIDIPTGNISYKNALNIIKHPALSLNILRLHNHPLTLRLPVDKKRTHQRHMQHKTAKNRD